MAMVAITIIFDATNGDNSEVWMMQNSSENLFHCLLHLREDRTLSLSKYFFGSKTTKNLRGLIFYLKSISFCKRAELSVLLMFSAFSINDWAQEDLLIRYNTRTFLTERFERSVLWTYLVFYVYDGPKSLVSFDQGGTSRLLQFLYLSILLRPFVFLSTSSYFCTSKVHKSACSPLHLTHQVTTHKSMFLFSLFSFSSSKKARFYSNNTRDREVILVYNIHFSFKSSESSFS